VGLTEKLPDEATYVPDESDKVLLGKVYDFLAAREQAGRGEIEPRYFLSGATTGDRVELPRHVYEVLRQVVEAMKQGLPVTVVPRSHVLTTQQAADLLRVSRPTVIKLLRSGEIPFSMAGSHRRLKLDDVLAYQRRRREEQYAALEATAVDYAAAVDYADEEDLETVLSDLRDARKAVARRHTQV
jgi:excisionase family DNA binding protein